MRMECLSHVSWYDTTCPDGTNSDDNDHDFDGDGGCENNL